MGCIDCLKYRDDCGCHLIDDEGHINYKCPSWKYTNLYGNCIQFVSKPKVKHQFIYETFNDWIPGENACWTECPFSLMIKLGERCVFIREDNLKCPFIKYIENNKKVELND